jgi:quercetin dioxygenase-like cupin family protein
MSDQLKLTPTESVIVRRSDPDLLEVEGIWGPGGKPPPKHFHPSQDERFEVIVGTLRARVDGDERDLRQGDVLDIPRGSVHQMWNPGETEARASWQTRPAGRTEQWFRAVDALFREGRVGDDGMPGPLVFGTLLSEYDDVFRLAVAPQLLVKPLVGILGRLGRARGYRAGD